MLDFARSALIALALLPAAHAVTYTPLNPPSYPLAVKNPYLSSAFSHLL
jgi:hypothetical protein